MINDFGWILSAFISSILPAGSILVAIFIYKIGQRDHKLFELRESMSAGKLAAERMSELLHDEMAYEITDCVINTSNTNLFICDVYDGFFSNRGSISENFTLKDLDDFFESYRLVVMGAVRTSYVVEFEQQKDILEKSAAKIDLDNPLVAKLLMLNKEMLNDIYKNMKNITLDEAAWKAAIKQLFDTERQNVNSVDRLKVRLMILFVGTQVYNALDKYNKGDIQDMLSATSIVIRDYLEKTPKDFFQSSKKEKSSTVKSIERRKRKSLVLFSMIDLLENVLTKESFTLFHGYASQIRGRESVKEKNGAK